MRLSLKTICIRCENGWCVYRLRDGSYLVIHDRDTPDNINKLIGTLGRWLNTDEREYALQVFEVLYKTVFKGLDDAESKPLLRTVRRSGYTMWTSISTHARVIAQVLRYFQQDTLATSEQGLKELCLMQYKCLGLTSELYDETRKIYLERKHA